MNPRRQFVGRVLGAGGEELHVTLSSQREPAVSVRAYRHLRDGRPQRVRDVAVSPTVALALADLLLQAARKAQVTA